MLWKIPEKKHKKQDYTRFGEEVIKGAWSRTALAAWLALLAAVIPYLSSGNA